jgi:multicomponent Na+:H+ antiporter subunit D
MMDYLVNHSPAFVVVIPLLGAFLTPLVSKIGDRARNGFAIIIAGLTSLFVLLLANDVFTNGIRTYVFGGSYNSGETMIRILFEIDGINAFMLIIAAILPFVAIVYSWGFMKEQTGLDKYYTLILLMTAGMLGMMMTGDMFNFFVFLEITSIASAALIAFWTNRGSSVAAGFKYIVISAIGALFVLFAIALLYGQYDALNMAVLANNIQFGLLDKIALVLLLAALAMKAGIVPMHMWLPDAYGRAPSSVTVVLIGTTLASLYGAFRVIFTIYGKHIVTTLRTIGEFNLTPSLTIGILIVALAVLTIIIGVFMALKQSDFKRMIAFAAVAEIGYMFLAIGAAFTTYTGTTDTVTGATIASMSDTGFMALKGGIFHILNDALDVSLLFLVAGAIYFAAKTTSLNKLGGLARNMKYTSVFFLIGLLAVSGLPPMNGFASKLMIYQSTYQVNPILAIVAILCSILLLATFVKVFHSAFLGPKISTLENVKEVPRSMLIAMAIIACLIVFIGLFPNLVVENIVTPAADALRDASSYIATIVGGVV